jgi:hypothetical protein
MNDTRKPFEPGAVMYRATNGQLLTNKNQALSRWKECFEQHLNESSQEETHTSQQPPRENGVINVFPSHGKIVEAIKYLKENKAVGLDSTAAELLKSGGPSLLNALNEMIQPVCIGETLPESWTEEVQCPVYKTIRTPLKRGRSLDTETYHQRCFSMSYLKRAKLQTTGTIFNKQTQLLAYADDIDIVARNLEAATIELNINKKKTKYMFADDSCK